MGKQETFNKVLALVEGETEVTRDLILSGNKREEVIDARSLLLYLLFDMGFYPAQIAALTGICPRCVVPLIQNFSGRKSSRKMLGIYLEKTKRKLREMEESSPL